MPIQILRDLKLPKNWGLYQAIDVIDGTTFEMYRSNMQSMIIDMVTEADMVLFNRCKEDMPLSGWKRSIRAVNRMCQMAYLRTRTATSWRWRTSSPNDLESPHIDLEDPDYGIWYLDIQEHPGPLCGQDHHLHRPGHGGRACAQGLLCPGRNAMTLLRRGHPLLRLPVQV